MDKKSYGNFGESKAFEYLKDKNYKILKQNYRCRIGEIDIVAKDKDDLVFVEVKTRSGINYGMPSEAVNFRKQQVIGRCAKLYINDNKVYLGDNCRFDVIEILTQRGEVSTINHYINAYQPKIF